jgi:excisionase family DNA binding protein
MARNAFGIEKDALTTGEVARICNVAARTVSKWIDAGRLEGYRIPGSRDRRVHVAALEAFVAAHGIPVTGNALATENATRILVFEHGAVVEAGTFAELVALNGRFARLAQAQFLTPATP